VKNVRLSAQREKRGRERGTTPFPSYKGKTGRGGASTRREKKRAHPSTWEGGKEKGVTFFAQ